MAIGTLGAIAIGSAVAGVGSAAIQAGASRSAANAQTQAGNAAIAEQRAAREELRRLMQPYVDAGDPALKAMMGLAGLDGGMSQAQAIEQQAQNPLFQGLYQQGEDAILQNAAATGGLRGGNVQGALAQFRPQLLNQFIEQQYSRLGGIATMGQNAAAGVGVQGMNTANQIGQQFGNIGAAQAGRAIGVGQATSNAFNAPFNALGLYAGLGGKLF